MLIFKDARTFNLRFRDQLGIVDGFQIESKISDNFGQIGIHMVLLEII